MLAKMKSGNLSIVIPSSKDTVVIAELLNTPPFTAPVIPLVVVPAQAELFNKRAGRIISPSRAELVPFEKINFVNAELAKALL